jgi:hypothetical protein
MLDPEVAAGSHRVSAGRAGRWLAAGLALALLAACEHGSPSFDRSTGQWTVPLGPGSRGQGSNR